MTADACQSTQSEHSGYRVTDLGSEVCLTGCKNKANRFGCVGQHGCILTAHELHAIDREFDMYMDSGAQEVAKGFCIHN